MSSLNQIPIYLINLDRRPDRLAKMTERLAGLPFIRISAIDGEQLKDLQYGSEMKKHNMTKNEIACILSHKKIWETIVDKKIPFACILEDDACLSSSFPDFIRDTTWLPNNFDVIKLETYIRRVYLSFKKKRARNRQLRKLFSIHFGTAGYIFSLEGANKLFDITRELNRPIDYLIFEAKNTNPELNILQISPALCIQEKVLNQDVSEDDSDIHAERLRMRKTKTEKIKGFKKLWREINRPYFQLLTLINLIKNKQIFVHVPFS